MKNPKQIPITPVESTATLPEVIKALNKVIESVNFMWEHDDEEEV